MIHVEPAGNTHATTPTFYFFDLFFRQGGDTQMEEQKYCKYCGAANPTSTSFCTKCSKEFASASASPLPPPSATKEKESPTCLRILEISAGLIIFILSVAAFCSGVDWGWTTFLAFLVIALIVLELHISYEYLQRAFRDGGGST